MYHYQKYPETSFTEADWEKIYNETMEKNKRDKEKRMKKEARRGKRLRKIVFYQTIDNPYDPDDKYNNLTALDERGKAIYYWQDKLYCGKPIWDVRPEDITSLDGWEKDSLWDRMHSGFGEPWWWRWEDWKRMKSMGLPGGRFDPMDGRVKTWTVKMYV